MKALKDYIEEDLFATPMNTTGMGGVDMTSGDVPCCACKIKMRKKKLRKKNTKK